MTSRYLRAAAAAFVALVIASSASSAQTTTQSITFGISAINPIGFTGAPSITITTAVAGAAPTSVTNSVGTWAVTTNQTGAKITGSIPTNMPAGLTLASSLAAPAGATSAGFQNLSTVAIDLVTSITKVAQGSLTVSYRLSATPAAGVITSSSRVVTYTITGGT